MTTKHLLFEGAGIGSGQLVLTISQNGTTIAQTGALLDLHDIKDFYEATDITNSCSGAVGDWTSAPRTVQYATVSDANETQDITVMVHGINVDYWHWVNASESVRKRLYWAGYHGKFMTVKWPCDFLWKLVFGVLTTDYTVFNKSELQGYTASTALKTYLDQLHARFPGYRVHLLAHSQGNSIVSEAIEAGATFDTYILTQAAMPTSLYKTRITRFTPDCRNSEAIYGPTPEWKVMSYRGIYTNMTGRIVNFYNPQDPVLDFWINDQGAAKPNVPSTPYTYDGTNGWYNALLSKRLVTDPHESRAYVSRFRTLPIGQSGPASGHGVIQSAVNLNAQFGFGHSFPDDHSAQWVWPIETTRPYFQQVLRSCQLMPAESKTNWLACVVVILCVFLLLKMTQHQKAVASEERKTPTNQSPSRLEPHKTVQNRLKVPSQKETTVQPNAPAPAPATTPVDSNAVAAQMLASWQAPIEFYGKVVDESSNVVAGAKVSFHWVEVPKPDGNKSSTTESDANGLFSLQGAHKPAWPFLLAKRGITPRVKGCRSSGMASFRMETFRQTRRIPSFFTSRRKVCMSRWFH